MTQTFIYRPENRKDDLISFSDSEAQHAFKVLRLKKGQTVRLIDGFGEAHFCEIISINSSKVNCRIIKTMRNSGEPSLNLTLAVGLSGSTKFNSVIEKGTEVGISRFIPLISEKGKVKIEGGAKLKSKFRRWRRVCEASAKQSGRSIVPAISEPVHYIEFINQCDPQSTILFHPGAKANNISETIAKLPHHELMIITGPESGFSSVEIELANNKNIHIANMGDRILRTETAGVVFSALAIFLKESVKA